jgi:hypothetical protein
MTLAPSRAEAGLLGAAPAARDAAAPAGLARSWRLGSALLLLLAAFALRAADFGNPVLNVDEQLYLLVGDRMLQGALPYVDIWDRKPIGLFAIYAGIRLLGGEGIYQYQIVATLFAAATGWMIALLAARFARPAGAVLAGLAYLACLGIFGGASGQSPVFYNLFTTIAAWLTLRAAEAAPAARLRLGCAAMLVAGLAIQVKYTAVFEGIFFGCVLLRQAWRAGAPPGMARQGRFGALLWAAGAWIACGLLPTAAALGFYALQGEAAAFIYANFLSVFARDAAVEGSATLRLGGLLLLLAPLLLCGLLGRWPRRLAHPPGDPAAAAAQDFVGAWAQAAIAGFLLFGTYYTHYALPLLAPLATLAAPALGAGRRTALPLWRGKRAWRLPAALLLGLFGVVATQIATAKTLRHRGSGAEVRRIAAYIAPRLEGCLFVFDGEPILYHLTGSCLPTRFAFPSHLSDLKEAGATGTDQVAEIRRIFATRPGFVVTWEGLQPRGNPDSLRALLAGLAEGGYRRVMEVPVHRHCRVVYQRVGEDTPWTPMAERGPAWAQDPRCAP